MRHQNKGFKLGRRSAHREATLAALSSALIRHKHITTTLTRAKALRMFVEPILSRGKADTTHNRRMVFRELQDKQAVTELFSAIGPKITDRPGGYTRVVKLGQRAGDSAEMALIELVDFGDQPGGGSATGRKRRTRRSTAKKTGAAAAVAAVKETAEAVVDRVEDVAEAIEDKVEDVAEAVKEIAEDVADKVEDVAEAIEDKVEDVVDAVKEKVEDLVAGDDVPSEVEAAALEAPTDETTPQAEAAAAEADEAAPEGGEAEEPKS